MSSEVDICNLALSYLGDDATVASLDPPEGSAQADHCARFYPIARDIMLDAHKWNFNTQRAALALLSTAAPSSWAYAYAQPSDVLDTIAVLAADAQDDTSIGQAPYAPQPFVTEVNSAGATVIYTNQAGAVLRYTAHVIDSTKFSPLFVHALTMSLASMLAGPVLKGETGVKAAMVWADRAEKAMAKAAASDANQQHQQVVQSPSWIANR